MATHVFTSSIIIHSESVNSPRESETKMKIYILNNMRSLGGPNVGLGFLALTMYDLCIIIIILILLYIFKHLFEWVGFFFRSMLMTAADLGASAKPWEVQLATAAHIAEEFYQQGDKEMYELNSEPLVNMCFILN